MLDDLSLNIMGIVKLGIPAWESTFAQYLIIEKKKPIYYMNTFFLVQVS